MKSNDNRSQVLYILISEFKHMINSKLKTAKGNIFDIVRFGFDALALVINQKVCGQRPPLDLPFDFTDFKKRNPGVFMVVYGLDSQKQPILCKEQVKPCIKEMLDHEKAQGRKRIGVFGAQVSDGIFKEGARLTFDAANEWLNENDSSVVSITLVDKQGGFDQFVG